MQSLILKRFNKPSLSILRQFQQQNNRMFSSVQPHSFLYDNNTHITPYHIAFSLVGTKGKVLSNGLILRKDLVSS